MLSGGINDFDDMEDIESIFSGFSGFSDCSGSSATTVGGDLRTIYGQADSIIATAFLQSDEICELLMRAKVKLKTEGLTPRLSKVIKRVREDILCGTSSNAVHDRQLLAEVDRASKDDPHRLLFKWSSTAMTLIN